MTSYSSPYPGRLADPTDVVGRRIGAYAIDLILMSVATLAVMVPLFMSRAVTAPSGTIECGTSDSSFGETTVDGTTVNETPLADGPALCVDDGTTVRYIPTDDQGSFTLQFYGLSGGLSFLNLVVLQSFAGGSVGKLVLGLRVVGASGQRAGFGKVVVRWLFLFIDSLCCFLPGAVLVFTTKGHRRLGDMVADTYVVRGSDIDLRLGLAALANPQGKPPGPGPGGSSWPTGSTYPGGGQGDPGITLPGGMESTWSGPSDPAAAAPSGDGPTWDPARDTYIQYDRAQGAWVEWDDTLKTWKPISR